MHVAEGSNMDDNGDYRPGLQAVAELGVKSPLRHSELYKEDIRACPKTLTFPPGRNSPSPVFLPVLCTARPSRRRNLACR